ncbi:MAG: SDR family NAD(P)-dependent oxidoreductase [Spongiibacteraceae bacterium]
MPFLPHSTTREFCATHHLQSGRPRISTCAYRASSRCVLCAATRLQIHERAGRWRLVLTTSASGLFGNFGQSNYSAAKMGMVGLMRVLAIVGARYNIKANALAPVAATRLTAGSMWSQQNSRKTMVFYRRRVSRRLSPCCAIRTVRAVAKFFLLRRAVVCATLPSGLFP